MRKLIVYFPCFCYSTALKTSPAIHEQRKQLERAKTGDLLKAKIQQRPDRQELERRHILEHDESHVDPSLAEKQRMLKKARLADQLNSQISHRPGPLELIKKNILHTEEPIERIVKEGLVSFKATSEGLLNRPQHPNSYVTFEEDSQSSEGDLRVSPPRSDVLEVAAASAGIVTVALTIPTSGGAVVVTSAPVLQQNTKFPILATTPYTTVPPPPPPLPIKTEFKTELRTEFKSETTPQRFAELCQSVAGSLSASPTLVPIVAVPSPVSLGSTTSSLSPLSSVASPTQNISTTIFRAVQSPTPIKSDAPGKDKYRKKSKTKPTTKARPIKFHEYKGPPNAQKSSALALAQDEETSYQLLLKQQNFLLEYLEGLHKSPNPSPATQKAIMLTENNFVQLHSPTLSNASNLAANIVNVSSMVNVMAQSMPSPAPSVASSIATTVADISASDLSKLEKMKVSDLKNLLKKRNLPVSGPKPQLIERLKPFLPIETSKPNDVSAMSESGEVCDIDTINSPHFSLSPESDHEQMDVVLQVDSPISIHHVQQQQMQQPQFLNQVTNEDLVREQQRKIDELQRKLRESQEELLQMKQNQTVVVHDPAREQPINHKLIFKQQLEAKIQKEKMQQIENLQRQQKEYLASQQQVLKNSKAAATTTIINNNGNNNHSSTTNSMSYNNSNGIINHENNNNNNKHGSLKIISNSSQQQASQQSILVPKEEAPALAFNENALQQLANKNNVEILWNGESAVFLVGPLQNKKLINGHQRATSMPSILVPITTATGTVLGTEILSTVKQQEQQPQIETINVESIATAAAAVVVVESSANVASSMATHTIPPPQYAEATKQLQQQLAQSINSNPVDGNVVSPDNNSNPNPIIGGEQQPTLGSGIFKKESAGARPGKRVHRNSQMITDVLEILIKNGDLPESAAQVPITPTTPNGNANLTENLIYGNNLKPPNSNASSNLSNSEIDLQEAINNAQFTVSLVESNHSSPLMNNNKDVSTTNNLTIDQSSIQDVTLLSPIPDNSTLDCDSDPAKTLDMFLNEHHHHNSHHTSDTSGERTGDTHKSIKAELSGLNANNNEDMDQFDDLEFMALMKLDMDIGDDSCQQPHMNDMNTNPISNKSSMPPVRRNMDASLQPSLSEIIQQQQQEQQANNNNNNNNGSCFNGYGLEMGLGVDSHRNNYGGPHSDNNGNTGSSHFATDNDNNGNNRSNNTQFAETPMDIEDFSNSLSSFDFPSFHMNNNHLDSSSLHSFSMPHHHNHTTNNSSTMNFSSPASASTVNTSSTGFGGLSSSLNDSLNTDSVGLLYESHLPMNHDYNLELFDDLRIPTTDSMSWNEMDFPIFGK